MSTRAGRDANDANDANPLSWSSAAPRGGPGLISAQLIPGQAQEAGLEIEGNADALRGYSPRTASAD